MKQYLELLKERNLKATPQRLSVLKTLGSHIHPTMEELYDHIKAEHPSVSLATVYKNVNTLKDEGLIAEINTPGEKTRYDIFCQPHIHVVCSQCGKIQDFPCDVAFDAYQTDIESKVGESVKRIDVVATVETCKYC